MILVVELNTRVDVMKIMMGSIALVYTLQATLISYISRVKYQLILHAILLFLTSCIIVVVMPFFSMMIALAFCVYALLTLSGWSMLLFLRRVGENY